MSIIKNYQSGKGTCKVTFTFPIVEGVSTIQVLGDFNNWDSSKAPKMKKSKSEYSAALDLKAGQSYEFRYLLDGVKWENDSNADNYVVSPFNGINNSVIVLEGVVAPKATATKTPAKKAVKTAAPKVAKAPAAKVAVAKPATAKAVKPVAAKADAPATKVAPKAVKVAAPKATAKATKPAAPKAAATKTVAPKATAAPKATTPKVDSKKK